MIIKPKRDVPQEAVDQIVKDLITQINRIEYMARWMDNPEPTKKMIASLKLAVKHTKTPNKYFTLFKIRV